MSPKTESGQIKEHFQFIFVYISTVFRFRFLNYYLGRTDEVRNVKHSQIGFKFTFVERTFKCQISIIFLYACLHMYASFMIIL